MKPQIFGETRPMPGETENGDGIFIAKSGEHVLGVVIDALGHGPKAAEVTAAAFECLEELPVDLAPDLMVDALDRALKGSRGAALTVVSASSQVVRGCGIGNVFLRTTCRSLGAYCRPGVVGRLVQPPRVFEHSLARSDRILVFSDGIRERQIPESIWEMDPVHTCQRLLDVAARKEDDASALLLTFAD